VVLSPTCSAGCVVFSQKRCRDTGVNGKAVTRSSWSFWGRKSVFLCMGHKAQGRADMWREVWGLRGREVDVRVCVCVCVCVCMTQLGHLDSVPFLSGSHMEVRMHRGTWVLSLPWTVCGLGQVHCLCPSLCFLWVWFQRNWQALALGTNLASHLLFFMAFTFLYVKINALPLNSTKVIQGSMFSVHNKILLKHNGTFHLWIM
jgi:hypothetical protein